MASTDKMASTIGNVTGSLDSLIKSMGSASALTAKYTDITNRDTQAKNALGKSINFFDAAVKANIATLNKNAREMESLDVKMKNFSARTKLAVMRTQHWTKTLVDLGNVASQSSKKIVSSVGAMSSSLETTTAKFKNLRDVLLEFNRTSFEVSRSADSLGKSASLTPQFWNDVAKGTALSKQQFLDLQKQMLRMSETTPLVSGDFLDLVKILQDRLGPAFAATEDSMQRLFRMENKIPGITKELTNMATAGKSLASADMSNITLLMQGLGGDVRDLDIMSQIVKKATSGQKELMAFETAAMKRDQAVRDANINTAKTAEESMMNIEKAMTRVTKQIDKMLQKFTGLVDSFVYIKQVASISFGGLIAGLGGVIRYVQTLSANFIRAAALSKGITLPPGVAGAGAGGGSMGGLGMLGGAMAMIPAGMQAYQSFREMRGPGEGASIHDRYAAAGNRNKGIGRAIGTGAGMLIGGTLGSVIPGAGTVGGASLGGWAGGAIGGYLGGKGGQSEDEVRSYEKIAAALDKRKLKVEGVMKSEQDVVRTIMSQKNNEDKVLAVHAILNDGLMDEKKLREAALAVGSKEVA